MFKQILLPIDLEETELTERAVEIAKDYIERYDSKVTALSVIPDFSMPVVATYFPKDTLKKAHDEICDELTRFIAQRFPDPSKVHCTVGEGSPHKIIVGYAREHEMDLIIMPSRGHDISKVFLGSSTAHVAQRAPCSVLVVRP